MITCFDGILMNPIFLGVLGVGAVAAFVMVWMLKYQSFNAKPYYAIAFVALIWTLVVVGAEAASDSFLCQYRLAILAWLGNATVPVAWCFFVFGYVDNASWTKKRSVYCRGLYLCGDKPVAPPCL